MKPIIVSTLIIFSIVATWGIFIHYVNGNIHQLIDLIEEEIEVSIYEEDWPKAYDSVKELSDHWHKHKKVYSFFFSTLDMNEADYAIARAKAYISTKNLPLAAAELASLREQFRFLYSNELVSLENIL